MTVEIGLVVTFKVLNHTHVVRVESKQGEVIRLYAGTDPQSPEVTVYDLPSDVRVMIATALAKVETWITPKQTRGQ